MNYEMTDDQITLQNACREFCGKEILPGAAILDSCSREEASAIMKGNLKKLGLRGYLGMGINRDFGGKDADMLTTVIAGEEIAKACASTFITAASSAVYFGYALSRFGNDEQKKRYLPGIVSGEKIGAIAVSEYDAGSDDHAMNTTASRKGNSWILNGVKSYVTNAPVAEYFLVAARSDGGNGGSGEITFFIVERGCPGFSEGELSDTMGLHGAQAGEIIFNHCIVDSIDILGVPGQGADILGYLKNYRALFTAVCSLGISCAAMESANRYSKERKSFGRYINRYQEIAFRLAEMMIQTDISRLLIYKAAWELDNHSVEAESAVSCAKIFSTETAALVSGWAVQIYGGKGYLKGSDVERFYRDAKFGEIAGGTSELHRLSIASEILDRYCN